MTRLLAAYLVALWLLALLPLSGTSPTTDRDWVAAVPFQTILAAIGRGLTVATLVSVVGNVVAFLPLGWLGAEVLPGARSWPRALALGLAVSGGIEAAQLGIGLLAGYPYRMTDIDDILLNLAGTAIGFAAWQARDGRRGQAERRARRVRLSEERGLRRRL
jgi:glycopeptide antibiotics resistance protein